MLLVGSDAQLEFELEEAMELGIGSHAFMRSRFTELIDLIFLSTQCGGRRGLSTDVAHHTAKLGAAVAQASATRRAGVLLLRSAAVPAGARLQRAHPQEKEK